MLVSGGMEDDRWSKAVEDVEDGVRVADIDEHLLRGTVQERSGVMEGGLVPVQEDDELRVELIHLSGDPGSDRPPRSGDQNPARGERPTHAIEVRGDLLTLEEVFDAELMGTVSRRGVPPGSDVPY